MYRVFLILSVLNLVWGDPCLDLKMVKALNCAKNQIQVTNVFGKGPMTDDIKHCFPVRDISYMFCIAKAKGYLIGDETVDRKALADLIDKGYENNPQLAENIKTKCIFADLSEAYEKLYKNLLNDIQKIERCIDGQVFLNVGEWDDEGECHGAKSTMEECVYAN